MNGSSPSLLTLSQLAAHLGEVEAHPATVKSCCAAAYGSDLMAVLLGESYHPGGATLTRHLADMLALRPSERVLDVAAGIGTTAFLLTAERGVSVVGIDLGNAQVTRARARATEAGLDSSVRFEVGDAERLPVDDASFDAAVCECAFCTFPDKPTAAAELARSLRPGGRLGMSDVWLDPRRLDPDLRGLAGRVACLADARPIEDLQRIIEEAGLRVTHIERHDDALLHTIESVTDRIRAMRLADLPILRSFDIARAVELAIRAAASVRRGDAGYVLLTATKP